MPPIFALSPYEKVIRRETLLWGTFPILCRHARSIDKMVTIAEEMLERKAGVLSGQIVGIVAGTRTRSGATNFMRLHTMARPRQQKHQSQNDKAEKQIVLL